MSNLVCIISFPVRSRCFLSAISDDSSPQTTPHNLIKCEREAIVAHFKALPEAAQTKSRIFELCLSGRPPFLIKHGNDVLAEADTQYFFYCLSRDDPLAPLIPCVFDAFLSAEGLCFLVMQKIEAPTLKASGITREEAVGHAASAVKWLLDQTPFIPASVFGRISLSNAPVWHQFFKEHQAPRAFDDAGMLLTYVQRVWISSLTILPLVIEPFLSRRHLGAAGGSHSPIRR